jgi:hypothetical protein
MREWEDIKSTGSENVHWIYLSLVGKAMNCWVHYNAGNFFTS